MFRLSLIALSVWATTPVWASAADDKASAEAGNALFAKPEIREIRIAMSPEAMRSLARDTRTYVRADVKEGGTVCTNVGIHLKGVGSFRPLDQKPAFTLKFNEFVPKQNFYGLTKISLNNSVQDATYANEVLCTETFRMAGVPAARVTHARVHLNDRYLGLYALVEGLNKPFLRRHFSDAKGNLYEGHTKDVNEWLDQDNGDNTTQSDLKALVEATRAPASQRWVALGRLIDLDRFMSMLACEVIMAHWDGYWLNRNNYCIYNDPGTKRMTFIPHGLDNMFQLPTISWRPTMQGLIVRAALQTPEGQKAYRDRVATVLTSYFPVERLTNRIDAVAAEIRSEFKGDALPEFDRNIADLKHRIVERIRNVSEQIGALGRFAKFDAAGVARLSTGWSTNVDVGIVTMPQGFEDKRAVLKIKHADTSGCIASWRTRVALEGGRYKFRGKAKAEGLLPVGAPNVGVTLRVSGARVPFQIVQDTDWRQLEFEFDVLPPSDDVDMICELSTVLGEVWFDLNSLELIRLRTDRSVAEAGHPKK
jgi:spore coat protein H